MEHEPANPPPGGDANVYEMLWDCDYCGTKKLLGLTHRFCPNCGGGQNPQKRYFPPDEEKVAVKDHPYCGADRLCPSCRNPASAKAQFCGQCGTPMEQAAAVTLKADQMRMAGTGAFADMPDSPIPAKARKKNAVRPLLMLLAAVLIGVIAAAVLWTKTVTVRLDHASWERSIEIDAFLPRQQADWCDSMPSDGYAVARSQKVRSQRQVPDGETCNTRRVDRGDGTYQEKQECTPKYRNEPVYGDYCSYTVNRWGHARSVVTSGQAPPPYWGEVRLNGAGGQCQACEREASRQETLRLHFTTGGSQPKTYNCQVPPEVWNSAKPNSAWTLKAGKLLGGARCNSLRAVN